MDISTEELEQFLSFSPGFEENASEEKELPDTEENASFYEKTEEQFSKVDALWEKLKSTYDPAVHDRRMLEDFLPSISPAMFNFVEGASAGTGLLKMGAITVPFDITMEKSCKLYEFVNTDGNDGVGAM